MAMGSKLQDKKKEQDLQRDLCTTWECLQGLADILSSGQDWRKNPGRDDEER